MVWVRMGLLDDAIREHLELKRRRGADPGEVAREQREALDSGTGGAVDVGGPDPGIAPPQQEETATTTAAAVEPSDPAEQSASPEDQPSARHTAEGLGETAELDMSSVLGDDEAAASEAQHADTSTAAQTGPTAQPARAPVSDEDSLEWEMPGEGAGELAEEPAEDVLEETPDFLRDTPEQERLWFEQRPPRDFDFDK
jgi:hypothetical protein